MPRLNANVISTSAKNWPGSDVTNFPPMSLAAPIRPAVCSSVMACPPVEWQLAIASVIDAPAVAARRQPMAQHGSPAGPLTDQQQQPACERTASLQCENSAP